MKSETGSSPKTCPSCTRSTLTGAWSGCWHACAGCHCRSRGTAGMTGPRPAGRRRRDRSSPSARTARRSSRSCPARPRSDRCSSAWLPRTELGDPVKLAGRRDDRCLCRGGRLGTLPRCDRGQPASRGDQARRADLRAAEAALEQPGSAILHVGDDWAADVVGAIAAGWRAAYLRDRQSVRPCPDPTRMARSPRTWRSTHLGELEAALTDVGPASPPVRLSWPAARR